MLIVVRHGSILSEFSGRWQGRRDVPLSQAGLDEARSLAPLLRPFGVCRIISSPLSRTKDTADILGAALALKVETADALLEMGLGLFQGLSPEEMAAQYPRAWEAYVADISNVAPPGGESHATMAQRVIQWAMEIPPQETTLLVTHTGPLLALATFALGLPGHQRTHLHPPTACATGISLEPPTLHFFGLRADLT